MQLIYFGDDGAWKRELLVHGSANANCSMILAGWTNLQNSVLTQ